MHPTARASRSGEGRFANGVCHKSGLVLQSLTSRKLPLHLFSYFFFYLLINRSSSHLHPPFPLPPLKITVIFKGRGAPRRMGDSS